MSNKPIRIRDKTIFDGFLFKNLLKLVYSLWFRLSGWKAIENPPEGAGITIAAPHTSNWDIVYALGAAIFSDVKIYFSIKESWCRLPLVGRFILWTGGIPINRNAGGQGQVAMIKEFVERHKHERVFFLFTPEGTRGGVKKWKTGFYHVAQETGLPIFLAKVDFRKKESGVFHAFELTGDKDKDIANLQESYKSVCGRFPDQQFPVYSGPLPTITARETSVLKALYALKGQATQAEIKAKARFEDLSGQMLDFLVDKGVIERLEVREGGKLVTRYTITVAGSGCLFHLAPSL
ncbi:MAG: acyltransferase [Oleiphilus sp.]|nr:MAG: acyltransferase [Oleiphilus sp.]